jgi:hypothetical protein
MVVLEFLASVREWIASVKVPPCGLLHLRKARHKSLDFEPQE